MPALPAKVLPGDLITSDFMNLLVDVCADLQQRVGVLEHPSTGNVGALHIDSLLPSGTRRIGDTIHVIGAGFSAPSGTVVTIDGIGVTVLPGADPNRELIVTIPGVQGVTNAGRNITLLVTSSHGTDSMDFVVFPAMVNLPQGQIFTALSTPPSPANGRLEAGQSYTFIFSVQVIVNTNEDFLLEPAVNLGWAATIVNSNNDPIDPTLRFPEALPPAGTTQFVRVRVAIPTGTADQTEAQLRLTVSSTRNPNGMRRTSPGDIIRVNAAPPPPMDVAISLSSAARTLPSQREPTTTGGVVRIGSGGATDFYRITLSAQIRANTTYNVALTGPASTAWSASFSAASTSTATTIGPVPTGSDQPILLFLRAAAGAADTELIVTVTSTTDATRFGRIIQPIGLLPPP
jgi:hypothetical protein